jgi:hypothetical protein
MPRLGFLLEDTPQMFKIPAYDPFSIVLMGAGILLAAKLALFFWAVSLAGPRPEKERYEERLPMRVDSNVSKRCLTPLVFLGGSNFWSG